MSSTFHSWERPLCVGVVFGGTTMDDVQWPDQRLEIGGFEVGPISFPLYIVRGERLGSIAGDGGARREPGIVT